MSYGAQHVEAMSTSAWLMGSASIDVIYVMGISTVQMGVMNLSPFASQVSSQYDQDNQYHFFVAHSPDCLKLYSETSFQKISESLSYWSWTCASDSVSSISCML